MEVIVGKNSGFCSGVKNAVKKAEEQVLTNQKIYCLGELVHNNQVIDSLEKKGMITVNNLEQIDNGEKVIFRAHGEPKEIYELAYRKKLEIIDLTCGKVKIIHDKVDKQKENCFIIILGEKKHPEVIGTKSFAGENSYVIENEDDILDAYMKFENTSLSKVYIVGQTTMSNKLFNDLSKEIEKKFVHVECIIDKTICNATQIRQEETMNLSKDFHTMIIIGGKNSANTKALAKISEENSKNVYCIETADEIKEENFINIDRVGIIAGASTPEQSIEDVKNKLKNLK